MEYILVAITVLVGSGLTFFSGFGLGTLMLPVFSLFFELPVAIGATAIVHFSNNIFKFFLVRKDININVFLIFGLPAIAAAFLGGLMLNFMESEGAITNYTIGEKTFTITWLNLSIGSLMIFFALFDLNPKLKQIEFNRSWLPIGGVLSGFFGGFSGHQGAFRATFLTKAGLSKEAFIATSNAVSLLVDLMRMSVYFFGALLLSSGDNSILDILQNNRLLLAVGVLFAFAGTYFGKKLVQKTTIKKIQLLVGILLLIMGVLLGVGII